VKEEGEPHGEVKNGLWSLPTALPNRLRWRQSAREELLQGMGLRTFKSCDAK
jgi:hypothetical protein